MLTTTIKITLILQMACYTIANCTEICTTQTSE